MLVRSEVKIPVFSLNQVSPLMLYVSDENGQGIYANLPFLNFVGMTHKDKVLGSGWADYIHADDRQAVLEHYLAVFYGRKPYTMEYRTRKYDDTYTWVQDIGVPYLNTESEFGGYVGLVYEFPAPGFSTEAPRAARCFLGEHSHVTILHRFDGTITYWGEAAATLYGWTKSEAQGRKLDELMCRCQSVRFTEALNGISESEDWSGPLIHQTKSGQSLSVQVHSAFFSDNPNVPLAARDLVTVICPQ